MSSSAGLYTSSVTSLANPPCRTSLTTPTYRLPAASFAGPALRRIRLPIALSPGK
jgi:hypothetical protein